jgi:ornithine cyclodeaminase/alanine dehydrogenase-like protein (mu-crystallin family)
MRIISEPETRTLVSVEEAHQVVTEAYADYGRERDVTSDPPLSLMVVPHTVPSICSAKGSFIARRKLWGVRMGMQMANYYTSVHDTESGRVLGLVDETWMTRRRVGTTAAVAARHLARADSKLIAMIGAGQLMEEVYFCMPHVFPAARFRISSRTYEGAKAFAARLGTPDRPPLTAVHSAAEAVDGADLVVSITVADEPMILPGMLKEGATVLSMGGAPEVAFGVLAEIDRLIVDEFQYALFRGDFAAWVNDGHISPAALRQRLDADIGEVVLGSKPGRQSPRERILAVIQGMAVCDLAMAAFCLEKAARLNIGTVADNIAQSRGRMPPEGNPHAARIASGLKQSRRRGAEQTG